MFKATDLFKERLGEHIKLLNRYLRYIFNGHFMIALMFIIIALSVYYQKWLEDIPNHFPGGLVIAFVLGVVASYNPIQTFLKEPDKVFLIVKEAEMHQYFRLALVYNFAFQLYLVIIALAASGPLYGTMYPDAGRYEFILLIIIVLILKGWNMAVNWMMFKVRNPFMIRLDKVLRTLISISLLYFFIQGTFVYLMVILFFIVTLNDYILSRKQGGLAWDVLIENDQHRLSAFYRFVSMFAEVPQLTRRLKKHRLLSKIVHAFSPFKHGSTFDYLYRLTFIRSNDYLGLFVRLTVIGALLIYVLPNPWLKIAMALLFLYMTSFQLIPLYYHHRTSIWIDMYPIETSMKKRAFLKGSLQLSLVQTIVFALFFLIWLDFVGGLLTLVLGGLFNLGFHYSYVKKKIST